jgi:hypothetical protein
LEPEPSEHDPYRGTKIVRLLAVPAYRVPFGDYNRKKSKRKTTNCFVVYDYYSNLPGVNNTRGNTYDAAEKFMTPRKYL